MLSGANAFEISDIETMNIGRLGRNNITWPVVTRINNSPGDTLRSSAGQISASESSKGTHVTPCRMQRPHSLCTLLEVFRPCLRCLRRRPETVIARVIAARVGVLGGGLIRTLCFLVQAELFCGLTLN